MDNVLIVEPDETIRRLIEIQLKLLGRTVVWSGAEAPADGPNGADVAILDPAAFGSLDFAASAGVPVVFVSAVEPTHETRALEPRAHLTMPYGLADLARVL